MTDLTDRDKALLLAVYRNRYLSFAQIQRAFFADHHAPVSRRLQKLVARGYLGVFERLVVRGGRPKYFFLTQTLGANTVRALITEERLSLMASQGRRLSMEKADPGPLTVTQLEPGRNPQDLDHCTEVADVWSYLHLATLAPNMPQLFYWETERQRRRSAKEKSLGAPHHDFRFVLNHKNDFILFLGEHDRCHEPLSRFKRSKIQAYDKLQNTGTAWELYGVSEFLVLVTLAAGKDELAFGRMLDLSRLIVETVGPGEGMRYWFTFHSRLSEKNILGPVWFPATAVQQAGDIYAIPKQTLLNGIDIFYETTNR